MRHPEHQIAFLFIVFLAFGSCSNKEHTEDTSANKMLNIGEKHRPQFHFTPDSMWMNDPNGMVFYKDTYHLFYQYYPDSTVWGPMHWGHAVSKDMIAWRHKPVALYPDDLGYIFSGSAVVDWNNTSGLGTAENPPLIAIFTYHDPDKAKAKQIDVETQGIAFSLDNGETWNKYENNPVLLNPGIRDFRDPKVRWHDPSERWIMTLAAHDHIRFYSSPDLKEWSFESEFGKDFGAHGGVWECPDLFPMNEEKSNETSWILIVNLNPGAPNGGSGTQYFIGNFDGHQFVSIDENTRWLDYGPDNYAGVTWSNTGDRTLFIGWMSNWKYANIVPTERWRSATTIARELKLRRHGDELAVHSLPVSEFDQIAPLHFANKSFKIHDKVNLSQTVNFTSPTFELNLNLKEAGSFSVVLSNEKGNSVMVIFDAEKHEFLIDRSNSGDVSFHKEFESIIKAPRFAKEKIVDLRLVVDVASIELFADGGSTVMTAIYFPDEVLDQIEIVPEESLQISQLELKKVK